LADHAAKLPLVDGDHVIEAIPPKAPDPALGIPVLPWRPRGGADLLETERLDPTTEFRAVDRIIVAEQESARQFECTRFHDLLGRPRRGRVLGHVEVQDPSRSRLNTKNTYITPNVIVG